MKKFMAEFIRVVFTIVALIALIPTNGMRFLFNDPGYHLKTRNKSWDFLIGLVIVLFGIFGLNKAVELNFQLVYSHGLTLNEFFGYHLAGITCLVIGAGSWALMMYSIVKSCKRVADALWSVEL